MSVTIDKKRHRPSNLNLTASSSNSDLALRIVSPGIPQLNREMILTIRILKEIELQQKNLIASRNKGEENEEEEGEDEEVEEDLTGSNKRLKRNFVPQPLNITAINDRKRRIPRNVPYTSVGQHFPHPVYPAYPRHVPYTATGPYFPGRNIHLYPYTSLGTNFPKREFVQTPTPHPSVTDVYVGDYIKTAPLNSQPLSSQQEMFDRKKLARDYDDDNAPVTDEEIKEMQKKYDQGSSENSLNLIRKGEIFGSINLMNESVFNYKIFKNKRNDKEGKDKEEKEKIEEGEKESRKESGKESLEETEKETEKDAKVHDDLQWLVKEKEKFLKICETSWDVFVKSKQKQ